MPSVSVHQMAVGARGNTTSCNSHQECNSLSKNRLVQSAQQQAKMPTPATMANIVRSKTADDQVQLSSADSASPFLPATKRSTATQRQCLQNELKNEGVGEGNLVASNRLGILMSKIAGKCSCLRPELQHATKNFQPYSCN